MLSPRHNNPRPDRMFQSSPGPKAGCYVFGRCQEEERSGVSILTRPEGRMLYLHLTRDKICFACFNPHPARRPDAMQGLVNRRAEDRGVSILTRPEGRMLWEDLEGLVNWRPVSILTRPEGRMLSGRRLGASPRRCQFQSSPGPKAGCYQLRGLCHDEGCDGFNPHPARRPDAMAADNLIELRAKLVSILTRPEGRMLSFVEDLQPPVGEVSILTRPEGRMLYGLRARGRPDAHRFNPHPARRPDAIVVEHCIRPLVHVSILTRPEGRMLCLQAGHCSTAQSSFNPHPARRPDAMERPDV